MKYYIDILLSPDADFGLPVLWGSVYKQVHIALVENKKEMGSNSIAVSFPEYRSHPEFPLGKTIRLLANSKTELINLHLNVWLSRLSDYIIFSSIRDVPPTKEYGCFKRKNFKAELTKAKRLAKRFDKPLKQIIKYRKANNLNTSPNKCPFVYIESLHTHQYFFLSIEFVLSIDTMPPENEKAVFDTYGLSKTYPVPLF